MTDSPLAGALRRLVSAARQIASPTTTALNAAIHEADTALCADEINEAVRDDLSRAERFSRALPPQSYPAEGIVASDGPSGFPVHRTLAPLPPDEFERVGSLPLALTGAADR